MRIARYTFLALIALAPRNWTGSFIAETCIAFPSRVFSEFDMSNLDQSFDDVVGDWSGNIHSLRIEPSVEAENGDTFAGGTGFAWSILRPLQM